MKYYVYILISEKTDKYYIGQTNNLDKRIIEHNSGKSNYTKGGIPWNLVWYTEKSTRSEAMILEKKLKNLSRTRRRAFIEKYA